MDILSLIGIVLGLVAIIGGAVAKGAGLSSLWSAAAFIIVILGGMGSVRGAILGSLVFALSQTLGAVLIPGSLGLLIPLFVFVALLLVRPSGLFRGTV